MNDSRARRTMAETAAAMRGMSTGRSAFGQIDHVHDALGDVDRLIAYALQVGIDLGDRENEAQIDRHGLLHGEKVERQFVDFALGDVDLASRPRAPCWQRVRSRSIYAWQARSTACSASPPMRSKRARSSSSPC